MSKPVRRGSRGNPGMFTSIGDTRLRSSVAQVGEPSRRVTQALEQWMPECLALQAIQANVGVDRNDRRSFVARERVAFGQLASEDAFVGIGWLAGSRFSFVQALEEHSRVGAEIHDENRNRVGSGEFDEGRTVRSLQKTCIDDDGIASREQHSRDLV